MGQRTRDNARNFFSLDFLTGNNARREAAANEAAATELWLNEFGNLPGSDYYFVNENEIYRPVCADRTEPRPELPAVESAAAARARGAASSAPADAGRSASGRLHEPRA